MANIIIVDDDHVILDIVELWLEGDGHTVSKVNDGDLAQHALNNKTFDILITDLFMPKTDGLELIRAVRRDGKDIGVIAMSAGGTKGANYLGAAGILGANMVLDKPLIKDDVLNAVEALIGGLRPGR